MIREISRPFSIRVPEHLLYRYVTRAVPSPLEIRWFFVRSLSGCANGPSLDLKRTFQFR